MVVRVAFAAGRMGCGLPVTPAALWDASPVRASGILAGLGRLGWWGRLWLGLLPTDGGLFGLQGEPEQGCVG
jgi:hypothetical protein